MSAVATLHFDPVFGMGSRNSFTWPVIDAGSGLLGQDLSAYAAESCLTPPSGSRSVTASPPRGTMTPEQRELKRQRDQARRDSKTAMRLQRAGSGSSFVQSPPVTMAELAAASPGLPVYTTAPAQMSLLTEPATTLAQSPYLASYSPPMPDHSQAMFPSTYQQPYLGDYSSSYPTTTAPSLAVQYARSTMPVGQDASLLYHPIPTAMSHATGPSQDGGNVRVVQTRPKPQCWEHGCNGRQFSTFSNLLRHQREKSGQAAKVSCPNCGAEFTRTTARNGHLQHDKCKQRRSNS